MYNISPPIYAQPVVTTGGTPAWALYKTAPRPQYPGKSLAAWCH